MKKTIVVIFFVICLSIPTIITVNAGNQEEQTTNTKAHIVADIYVDDDRDASWYDDPTHFMTINEGIEASEDGDIVFVFSGIYVENVIVYKSITLRGQNKETAIIDGNEIADTLFINTSFVTIKMFKVINSKNNGFCSGIKVREHLMNEPVQILTDISISNCILENNECGIRLDNAKEVSVSNCIINNNHAHSVYTLHSENIKIDSCEIFNNGKSIGGGWSTSGGIVTTSGSNNLEILNCNIYDNVGSGISVTADTIDIHNNMIKENLIGIEIDSSKVNVNIHNNYIIKNDFKGLWIEFSKNVFIYKNMISENGNNEDVYCGGIYLKGCSDMTIKSNIISSNIKYGILIMYSNYINTKENNFIENEKHASFYLYLEDGSRCNIWDKNYWDNQLIPGFPKFIYGYIVDWNNNLIPYVECDKHPAQEPYQIDI